MEAALVLAQESLADACGANPASFCELIFDITGSSTFAKASDWIARPLAALVILLVAWIVNLFVRRLVRRSVDRMLGKQEEDAARAAEAAEARASEEQRPSLQEWALARAMALRESSERSTQRTQTLGNVMGSVASIIIYTIAILMALGEFDINLGPLIASAGIVGIALGFGAQSLVKDFLSGIFMLLEDQYGVGDIVDVGDAAGVVEAVNLRTTQIRDVNGTLWHVPNGEIRRVGNKSQDWARAVLDVEVAYDTNIPAAMAVIKRVADEVWEEAPEQATILEEPEVWGVEQFGESSVVIRLAMKVEPAEQFTTARVVRARLKEAFDAAGIEIPFPQRTVWVNRAPDKAGGTARHSGDDPAQDSFEAEAPRDKSPDG